MKKSREELKKELAKAEVKVNFLYLLKTPPAFSPAGGFVYGLKSLPKGRLFRVNEVK